MRTFGFPTIFVTALAPFALSLCAASALAADQQAVPPDAKPPIMIPNSSATQQYDPTTGFPDHNGPLSGMLIVIPQGEVAEFNKPSGSERHLDRVARAEAGAVLALKLVFLGIKPDWQGQVDVVYDVTIIGPDGQPYGDAYHALSGVKGQADSTSGVFDNRNKVVLLQFEDSDKPGIYTIDAVLHDRVSGLDLPLQTQVELLARAPDIPGITVPDNTPPVQSATESGPDSGAASGTMAPIPDPQIKAPVRRRHHRRHH